MLTMLGYVSSHFSHRLADCNVVVEKLTMSASVPIGESRKFLAYGVEETHNDTNWSGLHIAAELVDSSSVGYTVVAVELHLFPNSKEDGGNHKNRWPVLQSVATVDAGVQ